MGTTLYVLRYRPLNIHIQYFFTANNPTLDALTEIHEYNMALISLNRKNEAVPVSSVVSLGTGLPPTTELKEIDVFRPDSIWDTAKLAYGISAIGNLLVDQATVSSLLLIQLTRF